MNFLAQLVSDNSRSWEKILLRHHCPQPPQGKMMHGVGVLFHSYPRVRFDLPGSINYINGFPKLGLRTLIGDHPRGSEVPLDSTGMISD